MSRRFHRPPGPDRGFTLLEILVATAIGAIVLLVINATFFGALRLHNTTRDGIDRAMVLQRTLGIVRRDLAGVMLPGGLLSGQFQTTVSTPIAPDITGDRISPDLYTTTGAIDGWNPFSEVQIVSYFLTPATDGSDRNNLVRVITRNVLSAQTPATEQQVLLSGVQGAAMEYFDGADWTDAWDSTVTSTLPSGIKFQVTLAPDDRSQPLPAPVELVVPVPVVSRASLISTPGDAGT